jgi:hypothetical protein
VNFLLFLFIFTGCTGLGGLFIVRRSQADLLHLVSAPFLGFVLLGYGILFLGLFLRIYPGVVVSALIVGNAYFLVWVAPLVLPKVRQAVLALNRREIGLLLLCLLFIGISLTGSLLPETRDDAMRYHLPAARQYAEEQRVQPDPNFDKYLAGSCLAEMIYTAAFLVDDQAVAKLLNWGHGILLLLILLLALRWMVSLSTGLLGASLFYGVPVLLGYLLISAKNDLFFLDLTFLSGLWVWQGIQTRRMVPYGLGAVFLGAAVGTKILALPYLGVYGLAIPLFSRHPRSAGKILLASALFLSLTAAFSLPWLIKCRMWTGQWLYYRTSYEMPVPFTEGNDQEESPFLTKRNQTGTGASDEEPRENTSQLDTREKTKPERKTARSALFPYFTLSGVKTRILAFPVLMKRILLTSGEWNGRMGLFLVCFFPLTLLFPFWRDKLVLYFLFCALGGVFALSLVDFTEGRVARYYLPQTAFMHLVAVYAMDRAFHRLRGVPLWKTVVGGILFLHLSIGAVISLPAWRTAFFSEGKREYLRRQVPVFEMHEYINQHVDPDARIALGNGALSSLYLDREVVMVAPHVSHRFLHVTTLPRFEAFMETEGITHLLFDDYFKSRRKDMFKGVYRQWCQVLERKGRFRRIEEINGFVLYERRRASVIEADQVHSD